MRRMLTRCDTTACGIYYNTIHDVYMIEYMSALGIKNTSESDPGSYEVT